jgi:hypothetical protein
MPAGQKDKMDSVAKRVVFSSEKDKSLGRTRRGIPATNAQPNERLIDVKTSGPPAHYRRMTP